MEGQDWKTNRVVYRRKPHARSALLTKKRLFVVLGVGILIAMYLGVYQMLHLPYFQVAEIEVHGTETIADSELRAFVKDSLSGDRWKLLPRSNILFVSPRTLESLIKTLYPEVRSAKVEKRFPRTVLVTLEERSIWAVYCGTNAEALSCFFLDKEGVLFREAPLVEGSLILSFHSELSPPPLGTLVFDASEVLQFQQISTAFDVHAGVPIVSFSFKRNAPKDVWVRTKEGFSIIIAKDAHPDETAGIVKAVLEKEVREKRNRLDYLDARFGNKVFVKYK